MRKVVIGLFGFALSLSLVGCGSKVKTQDGNVDVNTPDASVKVQDGNVDIKTPGAEVKTNGGDVEINTSGKESGSMKKKRNVVMIIDASGSMNAKLGGKSKMDIAKESAAKLIDKMGSDVNLSVVAYGHKGGNTQAQKTTSCNGIEEIYYFGPIDGSVAKSKINALPAVGWTPIEKSIVKAKEILAKYPGGDNGILLISDGEETCGGDPVARAKEVCAANMRVDVIGFNVSGVAETQLKNVSIGGCGAYASVDSADDFNVVINGEDLHVKASGTIIDIEGGSVKVDTQDALIQTGPDGVDVQTDGVDVKTNDNGVDVRMPGMPSINY